MAKGRTASMNWDDPRAVRTLTLLQDSFVELIARKPFHLISVREITDGAGVHYSTFFRRFKTKEDLLEFIVIEEVGNLLAVGSKASETSGTLGGARAMFRYVAGKADLWHALLTSGAKNAVRMELARLSREIGEERKPTNDWIPVDLAVPLLTGGTIEVLTWWLTQPERPDIELAVNLFEDLVTGPIMTRRPSPVG